MTLDNIALVTYPGLLLILAFFVRSWMADIKRAIEKYSEQQRLCQLSLATTYRTREEAEKAWASHMANEAAQDAKIGNLTTRVVKLEAQCDARHGN